MAVSALHAVSDTIEIHFRSTCINEENLLDLRGICSIRIYSVS